MRHLRPFVPRRPRRARPTATVLALALGALVAGCTESGSSTAPALAPSVPVSAAKVVDDLHGGRPLYAAMDGAQPLPNDKADHGGSGTAEFTLNPGQELLCVTVTVNTAFRSDITGAHIHPAVRGASSPIEVADLAPVLLPALAETGSASGCITLERAVIQELMKNPEHFYFNLHTPYNGIPDGGILRGQLSADRP